MSALILIVDDEPDLVSTLEYNFQREGYRTVAAATGADALRVALASPPPDLVVLDLMLPDMPGTEVCRRLRASANAAVPVVMLTAKAEEIDRVVGFEVGADDYVSKPFSVRELLLRVGAILRRAQPGSGEAGPGAGAEPLGDEILELGSIRVDPASHRAWVGGDEVSLTALEFRLLSTFMARKGRVQSRETLLADVWGIDSDVTTRTVDTHVKRLREKLGDAGSYIETLRGVGYRFRDRAGD